MVSFAFSSPVQIQPTSERVVKGFQHLFEWLFSSPCEMTLGLRSNPQWIIKPINTIADPSAERSSLGWEMENELPFPPPGMLMQQLSRMLDEYLCYIQSNNSVWPKSVKCQTFPCLQEDGICLSSQSSHSSEWLGPRLPLSGNKPWGP